MQVRLNRISKNSAISAPRVVAASLLALLLCGSAGVVNAAQAPAPGPIAPMDFGNPPSGAFPIIYNDHTVYATPDILKADRVLAALVKNGHIFVPLRSMFEQMGATVSASADGKTVTAIKPGSSVSVTLGKSEVLINGAPRPLDVPPMLYNGIVLVPVRVLSEALGAYVQWVPSRRIVVVRYIPVVATPPPAPPVPTPTPQPTAVPTPVPPVATAAPTAPPAQRSYNGFVQAAFAAPKSYNEFVAGAYCPEAYILSGGYAFKNSPFAVKVDFRQDVYVTSDNRTDSIGNHYTQFSTIDGGTAQTPVFLARQSSLDARLEYQVANPRIYVGVGYLRTSDNYGYPHLNALGVGVEKLPDLRGGVNLFGSAFYYPSAVGTYTVANAASVNFGKSYRQQYGILKYDLGLALISAHFPVYLYGGVSGDRYTAKQNAPVSQTHDGPYLGLGVKF